LSLRLVDKADLPQLLAINSDAEVVKYLGHPPWASMQVADAWYERISRLYASGDALEFVIVAKVTGDVIGRCALFEYEEANAHAALGYTLGRSHWRQGYMREALTALIDCAFSEMGLRRLETRIEAQNSASIGLVRSLGFTPEGVLRGRWLNDGVPMNAEIYGLLSQEWATKAPEAARIQ